MIANALQRKWDIYTTPQSPLPEEARKEYITRVVFAFTILATIPIAIVSIIIYSFTNLLPPAIPITGVISASIQLFGWWLILRGYWYYARYVLLGLAYVMATYASLQFGFGVPGVLLYITVMLFAAMITSPKVVWSAFFVSALSAILIATAEYIGLLEVSYLFNTKFTTNILMVLMEFGGIGALFYFLTAQFEKAIATAEATTQELKAYQAHLELLVDERTVQLNEEVTARREIQERLELALEGGRLGSWDWDVTTGNVITNKHWSTMLGYTLEELGNVTFNTWSNLTHPDDAAAVISALMAYMQGQTSFYEAEHRLRHKDGHWIWVLTRGKIVDVNTDGNPTRIVGIHQDIDERKRAENALIASERNLTKAQHIAKLGNWEWDIVSDQLVWSNETQQIFGLHPSDFGATGKGFVQLIYPDDLERSRDTVYKAIDNRELGYRLDHRILLPHNGIRMMHQEVEFEYGNGTDNSPTRAFGVIHDITEQWQAETKLKASLEEKIVLLKEIHHRVKNNLQIIGSLLYLQSRQTDNAVAIEALNDSYGRVQSMSLVHETLYQSGNLAAIEFENYVHLLVKNLQQSFRIRQISPNFQIEIDDIKLDIDTAIPCGLMLNELVTNALKYAFADSTVADPTITINIHLDDAGKRHFVVADNGIGLPDPTIARLTGAPNSSKSTSLGMSLIRQLSNQLNASLAVDNTRGTRIELTF